MAHDLGNEDAEYADRALALMAEEPVSPALETRILADFDRVTRPRPGGIGVLRRLADWLWPGAPVWQPAFALVVSLAMGLAARSLVPSSALAQNKTDVTQTATLDSPPTLGQSGDF